MLIVRGDLNDHSPLDDDRRGLLGHSLNTVPLQFLSIGLATAFPGTKLTPFQICHLR